MEKEKIKLEFENFLGNYNWEKIGQIWKNHQAKFKKFWISKLGGKEDLLESEIDEIVRILDRNAKGNTKENESVAKAMIPQGVWRRMFSEIKNSEELYKILSEILESNDSEIIEKIDLLYEINKDRKNGLTGKSANAINDFLVANSPDKYISVISLNERKKIIDAFNFEDKIDFENDTPGNKIYYSNKIIIEGLKNLGISASPRTITAFLYSDQMRSFWREYFSGWGGKNEDVVEEEEENSEEEVPMDDESSKEFALENELESFLVKNWENLELGKDYELILDENGMPSNQYKAGKWRIDILARKKNTNNEYLVIELKKGRAADKVVGQICRYLTWIKKHILEDGGKVKGLIISASVDDELRYAVEQLKDVELKTYKINFQLQEVERVF